MHSRRKQVVLREARSVSLPLSVSLPPALARALPSSRSCARAPFLPLLHTLSPRPFSLSFHVSLSLAYLSRFPGCSRPPFLPSSIALFPCPLPLPSSRALFDCPLLLPSSLALFHCPLPLPSSLALFPCPLPLPSSLALFHCPLPLPSSIALFHGPLPWPSSIALFRCPLPLPSATFFNAPLGGCVHEHAVHRQPCVGLPGADRAAPGRGRAHRRHGRAHRPDPQGHRLRNEPLRDGLPRHPPAGPRLRPRNRLSPALVHPESRGAPLRPRTDPLCEGHPDGMRARVDGTRARVDATGGRG